MGDQPSSHQCIIDIKSTIEKKIKISNERRRPSECTIFRAPPHLLPKPGSDNPYEPKVVSIGPYHRGKDHLKPMEDEKIQCLKRFLERNRNLNLEDCIQRMNDLKEKALRCYSEEVTMDHKEFVEMLLLDGCFILEFFLTSKQNTRVFADLLKLENQLPFFVLEELFVMVKTVPVPEESSRFSLVHLMIGKLNFDMLHTLGAKIPEIEPEESSRSSLVHLIIGKPNFDICRAKIPEINPDHLLDLFRQNNIPPSKQAETDDNSVLGIWFAFCCIICIFVSILCCFCICVLIFCLPQKKKVKDKLRRARTIVELREAGVKIRLNKKGGLVDIAFDGKKGELRMMPLYLHDHSISVLQNLIAMEQTNSKYSQDHSEPFFTSYACFINNLIDTQEDVALLERRGVLINKLGSNDEAAKVINQLSKGIVWDQENDRFDSVLNSMENYCHSNWPRWRAILGRDYFSTPWKTLSVLAALILLLLTTAQTFFTIYVYFRPPKSN